ncbi:RNA polymerase sigma factor [Nostoc sp.]|uniref:RNA polymerase sigma factor n=1 Tax=Nostoc sp. TaxID=1180 RepID=UPI002FF9312D
MVITQLVTISELRSYSQESGFAFWQLCEQYQDCLYRCGIKWMGGNPTEAENALSWAMLKAWEKMQKYAEAIADFKAWLTSLTHNLCVNIYRERSRVVNRVENVEIEAIPEEKELVSFENTSLDALETDEKKIVIRSVIANLPIKLRQTFILHFYQEVSYQEIAQLQDISYQNICKRISQMQAVLLIKLRRYFIGEERVELESLPTPS